MNSQAFDFKVEFLQKVYIEDVLSHQHAVWGAYTNFDRSATVAAQFCQRLEGRALALARSQSL